MYHHQYQSLFPTIAERTLTAFVAAYVVAQSLKMVLHQSSLTGVIYYYCSFKSVFLVLKITVSTSHICCNTWHAATCHTVHQLVYSGFILSIFWSNIPHTLDIWENLKRKLRKKSMKWDELSIFCTYSQLCLSRNLLVTWKHWNELREFDLLIEKISYLCRG